MNLAEFAQIDVANGRIEGAALTERRLSDLEGCFADAEAYRKVLAKGNPLLYRVFTIEPGQGAGDLHCALGMLMPGRIGDEYYLTKGHLHAAREHAEIYVGLSGEGLMLLEHDSGPEHRVVPLKPNAITYVPGHMAHRTMNTGAKPLVYLGMLSAAAGHDYGPDVRKLFRHRIVERGGKPTVIPL